MNNLGFFSKKATNDALANVVLGSFGAPAYSNNKDISRQFLIVLSLSKADSGRFIQILTSRSEAGAPFGKTYSSAKKQVGCWTLELGRHGQSILDQRSDMIKLQAWILILTMSKKASRVFTKYWEQSQTYGTVKTCHMKMNHLTL